MVLSVLFALISVLFVFQLICQKYTCLMFAVKSRRRIFWQSLALFSGRQGIYPRPRAFDKCQGPCAFDSCQGPTLLIKIVASRAPHIPHASGPTGAKNSPAKFFPFPSLRNDLLICLDSKVWNPQPVHLRLYPGAWNFQKRPKSSSLPEIFKTDSCVCSF